MIGSNAQKPALLYLSPLVPATTGNGLAMRAGVVLQLLSRHYRVYLLVRARYPSPVDELPAVLSQCCEEVVIEPSGSDSPAPKRRGGLASLLIGPPRRAFSDVAFAVVHVFRLAAVADALPYMSGSGPPRRHLDLDDVESTAQRRIAELRRSNGDEIGAAMSDLLARRAEDAERADLNSWDRVYVCSQADRTALVQRGCQNVSVLPNAVRSLDILPPHHRRAAFTLLFVGTLTYYPNEDGVRYFCEEVLPILIRGTERPVRVVVVGFGVNPGLTPLAAIPHVHIVGAVPDLTPYYADADAVIVPLRAGGGTRIKVLEAFARGRPVVSTALGCEGIPVRDGEHLLLASTAEHMAEQCLRLLNEPELGEYLAGNAAALVRDHYTLDALDATDVCAETGGGQR